MENWRNNFCIILVFSFTVYGSSLDSLISKMSKNEMVENSVLNDLYSAITESNSLWKLQSLKAFPYCRGCSSLLPCCPDQNKYRIFNKFYISDRYNIIAGMKQESNDTTYYFIMTFSLQYKKDSDEIEWQWQIVKNTPVVFLKYGEIIKDFRIER